MAQTRAACLVAMMATLLLAHTAAAQGGLNATQAAAVTLSSIQPPKLSVNLRFMINGEPSGLKTCTTQKLDAACLPKLQAASGDKLFVTYSVLPGVTPNLTDHVTLKVCYSNYSQVDRPWRATNNVISKSKKCPITIKKGLDPIKSNATGIAWAPNDNVATATYFVRAFVYHNSSKTVSYPVATGVSPGFFQVNAIDPRPTSMKIAAGICSCVGPLMFAGYFVLTFLRKKNV